MKSLSCISTLYLENIITMLQFKISRYYSSPLRMPFSSLVGSLLSAENQLLSFIFVLVNIIFFRCLTICFSSEILPSQCPLCALQSRFVALINYENSQSVSFKYSLVSLYALPSAETTCRTPTRSLARKYARNVFSESMPRSSPPYIF